MDTKLFTHTHIFHSHSHNACPETKSFLMKNILKVEQGSKCLLSDTLWRTIM
jgi:hypothetical protein